ncbi:MAG: GDSL-type esterase/lipase family protein [Anaerolineae bacterium]
MLKIAQLIEAKAADPENKTPVLAFLGDSVTQGMFETSLDFTKIPENHEAVYHNVLKEMIVTRYPGLELDIINAGVGGNTAGMGLFRLEFDVLLKNPDFCVVCFGLNDVHAGRRKLKNYTEALGAIFDKLIEAGIETVFMTPNMMCTYVSPKAGKGLFRLIAKKSAMLQNNGTMDLYMDGARREAAARGIPVCDCYARWKELYAGGFDVTEHLANYTVHPTYEMHKLFADELFKLIFADSAPAS